MNVTKKQLDTIPDLYRDCFCDECLPKMAERAAPIKERLDRGLAPYPWQVVKLLKVVCVECKARVIRRSGGRA